MVDPVEELLEIDVHHPALAACHVLLRATQRLMRIPSRSKAVARVREGRLKDRLQHLMQRLLDQAIHHRRNAQRAHPALRLGNVHAAHRHRPVLARQQSGSNRRPVSFQMIFELRHSDCIDSRCAFVLDHPLIREHEVAAFHHGFHQTRCHHLRFGPHASRQVRLGANRSRHRIPFDVLCSRLISPISFRLHRLS